MKQTIETKHLALLMYLREILVKDEFFFVGIDNTDNRLISWNVVNAKVIQFILEVIYRANGKLE